MGRRHPATYEQSFRRRFGITGKADTPLPSSVMHHAGMTSKDWDLEEMLVNRYRRSDGDFPTNTPQRRVDLGAVTRLWWLKFAEEPTHNQLDALLKSTSGWKSLDPILSVLQDCEEPPSVQWLVDAARQTLTKR